jgi:predicted Zn-dependent protease
LQSRSEVFSIARAGFEKAVHLKIKRMRQPQTKTLDEPSRSHLHIAQCCFERGNIIEAIIELGKIADEFQCHPDVLETRWYLSAGEGKWSECLDIARHLTVQDPLRVSGWIHLAHATCQAPGGTVQMAYDILVCAVERFKSDPLVFYHLARYSSRLGRLQEARQLLEKASLMASDAQEIIRMAANDPDLAGLRE